MNNIVLWQLGFDTEDKVTLLAAIAETSRRIGRRRQWITEVNWPLAEGPHSPAGRNVAVGEQVQADYLVRFYLAALGSGYVERVFWWQLVAKGYGLTRPLVRNITPANRARNGRTQLSSSSRPRPRPRFQ